MENEFPPNSHVRREAQAEKPTPEPNRKVIRRVTRGEATLRKRSLRKRFAESFTGEGNKGVFEYVLFDVLIPGIRDVVADVSTTAIERTLYPGDDYYGGRRHRGGRGGGGYTSYSRMGGSRSRSRRDDDDDYRRSRRDDRDRRRRSDVMPEIIVDSRVEAEEVIGQMFELISKYDAASMRDLLSMVGLPHNPTDDAWGWTDFRGAHPVKVRGGYLIDAPRPDELD